MAGVEIRSLTKVFPGGVRAVDRLDLHIEDGEFFALLGPSGCGKTTLLRTIAGLELPTGGSIRIGQREVTRLPPGDRNVAMVFQDYALYPHMTVTDNIAYPLKVQRVDKDERYRRAAEVAGSLALEELLARRPGQLSGGQQQRVALARAIACRPDVFLFDEPLSNLDARLRLEARTFLKGLQQDLGITTVYVTHDQAEALALADRMAVMEAGRIRQVGRPSEFFHRPANLFVAGFIGATPMNLLEGKVSGSAVELDGARLPLPPAFVGAVEDGQAVVYGVRPEYVSLHDRDTEGALAGQVRILENLGTHHLVSVEADEVMIRAAVQDGVEPAPGDRVWVLPDPPRSLLYRAEDGELVERQETPAGARL